MALCVYLATYSSDDHVYSHRNKLFDERLRNCHSAAPLCVVSLGSSRVQEGISACTIEEQVEGGLKRPCVSMNFACSGGGIITQWLYLHRLIESGRRIDVAIVEILPTNMGVHEGRPVELLWLRPERIRPEEISLFARYGFDESSLRQSQSLNRDAMIKSWDRLRFGFLEQINSRLVPTNVLLQQEGDCDSWGGMPVNPVIFPPARRPERIDKYLRKAGTVESWAPAPTVHTALCDMLRECRNRGIRVVLTFMPEASEFRSHYSRAAMADIHQYLDSLQRDWQVPVVFAQDWMPDSVFMDEHHLYEFGAVQFTKRLCRERLLPLMADCPRE
jgi:hypothetical protein